MIGPKSGGETGQKLKLNLKNSVSEPEEPIKNYVTNFYECQVSEIHKFRDLRI